MWTRNPSSALNSVHLLHLHSNHHSTGRMDLTSYIRVCVYIYIYSYNSLQATHSQRATHLPWALHEHQFQQPNDGGTRPVLLMCSACSAVLAAARFRFSSAAARFSSALCLADASLVISLSCARARIRSTSTLRKGTQSTGHG